MDLWIRSQDKDFLKKIDNINLGCVNDKKENEARRLFTFTNNTSFTLGTYKTKERALEILDEIQERIVNLQLVDLEEKGTARADVYKKEYLRCVYEMPKEVINNE